MTTKRRSTKKAPARKAPPRAAKPKARVRATPRPTAPKGILVRGGRVVTMNAAREVRHADVYVEGGRIRAIEPGLGRPRGAEVIEAEGRLVIPGLVQPHVHLCQTLFRGHADGLQLLDWLGERIWPFEALHDEASLYTSAMVGAAELLRTGTTAILDMGTVHHTDAIFRACQVIGIRATIGKAMMDKGQGVPVGLKETTEASLKSSIALAERWHGAANGRLRYAFAPRFVLSCTEELMKATAIEARRRGLLLHTHASENAEEIDVVRRTCGGNNVEVLHRLGLTGTDTVLAHCVWLTSEEQAILRTTHTHVAHCPSSNLKLASGIARIPDLLEQGINVALAADGAPCNNNLDAFVEMRLAGLIHKPRFGATAMDARTVFELATLRGAAALGLADEIGSLEVGKRADLAVVDLGGYHAMPIDDPYGALVYALHGSDVTDVVVDGVRRVADGKVLGVDPVALGAEARRHARRITEQALGSG